MQRQAGRITVALGLGLALAAGCDTGRQQAYHARPTPAPAFAGPIARVSLSNLKTYVAGLEFDTSHPAADAQFLTSGGPHGPALGPFAMIAPEIGAGSLDSASLDRGRIIARFTVAGSYAAIGLSRGVSYLWMVREAGAWRFIVTPDSTDRPIVAMAARLTPVLHLAAMDSVPCFDARFTVATNGITMPCVCCKPWGWCEGGLAAAPSGGPMAPMVDTIMLPGWTPKPPGDPAPGARK